MVDASFKVGRYELVSSKLEELDCFATEGFERLQQVFTTRELNDVHPVSEAYGLLESGLNKATGNARYVNWDRGMNEAVFFDKYILQLVIGHESVRQLYTRLRHRSLFLQQMSDSQEMMKKPYHDFEVQLLQHKDVSYSFVHDQIYRLVKNEKYDYIVDALKEIRSA